MFKILAAASLIFASFSMRIDLSHEQNTVTLNDDQSQWDKFFRDSIKAIGDSVVGEAPTVANGQTTIKYLDKTGTDGEVVGWEVTGNTDKSNKQVEKVVQVKATPNPKDKNISTVTKTTFERKNLLDVSKAKYAA